MLHVSKNKRKTNDCEAKPRGMAKPDESAYALQAQYCLGDKNTKNCF